MANVESKTVVGVFQDRAQAERAIEELKRAGVQDDQIGFAVRASNTEGIAPTGDAVSKTVPGAVAGTAAGAGVGGLIGAAAALLVPGLGPVVAGGILGATLASATAGAVGGGLLGALKGMGIPEEDVRHYQQEFDAGRTLVTVKTTGNQQQVMDILRRNGAQNADTGPVQAVTYDPTVGHDTVDPLDRY